MAQWGALVSSFNTSGVPVTLEMVRDGDLIEVEDLPYEPRMAESLKEIHAATGQLVDDIKKAVIAVREAYDLNKGRTVINEALRHLEITIINSQPNADYAAKTFAEHVENTVTKARADIEAMAQTAARAGLESGAARLLEIEANDA